MRNRILIPLDTLDARHPALEKARLSFPDAELFILHVLTPPGVFSPATAEGGFTAAYPLTEVQSELLSEARQALEQLGYAGEVAPSGQPVVEILRHARSGRFDFVLMGTTGKQGLTRLLIGSVTESVVRQSPIPVMTVRMTEERAFPLTEVQRILVMHDFSASADYAMLFAMEHFPEAQLDVLHVTATGAVNSLLPPAGRASSALLLTEQRRDWLNRINDKLLQRGGGEVMEGEPLQVALERVDTGRYHLVTIGSSSKSSLERMFLGSVAEGILRHSAVPVLTAGTPLTPQHLAGDDRRGG